MRLPWDIAVTLVFPRDSHGIPWDESFLMGIPIGLSWDFHEFSTRLLWESHGTSMGIWFLRGTFTGI